MRPPRRRGSDTSRTLALGAAVALALVAGAAGAPRPAAAGEARGELSVTVQVVSPCRATLAGRAVSQDCGADTPYPVVEAEHRVKGAEPPQAASALRTTSAAGTRYLTVIY